MQDWNTMRRQDFDVTEPLTLFDAEPEAFVGDEPGTLLALIEPEQIPCNLCGSTTTARLSLGHVALCADSTACYLRRERQQDAELAELFPECAPKPAAAATIELFPADRLHAPAPIAEPERPACLLCGDRESVKRILGQRRYDDTVTVVCDNPCNPDHELSATGRPKSRRFQCSCGAVSKPFATGAPIAAAAHRHAAVIARNVCGPRA